MNKESTIKPKSKCTFYLTEETEKKFTELYAFRLMSGEKHSKSDILCEALTKLYEVEFNKFK